MKRKFEKTASSAIWKDWGSCSIRINTSEQQHFRERPLFFWHFSRISLPLRQEIPCCPASIEEPISLWRNGCVRKRSRLVYLHYMAEKRRYKYVMWVSSGHRRAFANAVSSCNSYISNIFVEGSSSAWSAAARNFNEIWITTRDKSLSSLVRYLRQRVLNSIR